MMRVILRGSVFLLLSLFSPLCHAEDVPTRTARPEYFLRSLSAAVHSIYFDEKDSMWIGSLGDTRSEVGKLGSKKIYRISPDKRVSVVAEVSCTYTTAVAVDKNEQLYVACEGPTQIVKVSRGVQTKVADDGTYRLLFDDGGSLLYSANEQMFKVSPSGKKESVFPSGGLWDRKSRLLYGLKYGGGSITRREVKDDGTLGPKEIVADGFPFVKGLALNEAGELWMMGLRRTRELRRENRSAQSSRTHQHRLDHDRLQDGPQTWAEQLHFWKRKVRRQDRLHPDVVRRRFENEPVRLF